MSQTFAGTSATTRPDEPGHRELHWVTVKEWSEFEFQYVEYVFNIDQWQIRPEGHRVSLGHNPPLRYVSEVRSL